MEVAGIKATRVAPSSSLCKEIGGPALLVDGNGDVLACNVKTTHIAVFAPEGVRQLLPKDFQRAYGSCATYSLERLPPASAKLMDAPHLRMDRCLFDMDVIRNTCATTKDVEFQNAGALSLVLEQTGATPHCSLSTERIVVPPGARTVIQASLRESAFGPYYEYATLTTNDSENQEIRVAFQGVFVGPARVRDSRILASPCLSADGIEAMVDLDDGGQLLTILSVSSDLGWLCERFDEQPGKSPWRVWMKLTPSAHMVSGAVAIPLTIQLNAAGGDESLVNVRQNVTCNICTFVMPPMTIEPNIAHLRGPNAVVEILCRSQHSDTPNMRPDSPPSVELWPTDLKVEVLARYEGVRSASWHLTVKRTESGGGDLARQTGVLRVCFAPETSVVMVPVVIDPRAGGGLR